MFQPCGVWMDRPSVPPYEILGHKLHVGLQSRTFQLLGFQRILSCVEGLNWSKPPPMSILTGYAAVGKGSYGRTVMKNAMQKHTKIKPHKRRKIFTWFTVEGYVHGAFAQFTMKKMKNWVLHLHSRSSLWEKILTWENPREIITLIYTGLQIDLGLLGPT